MSLHQLNSKTNDVVLLLDYLKVLKLFPVATDGMDGNRFKLEKVGQFFRVLMLQRVPKILKKFTMVSPLQ